MRNSIILFFLVLSSCESQDLNRNEGNDKQQYSQDELQAIINKYDLREGTIIWSPIDSLAPSDFLKPQMTLLQFEEMVANEAAYQKSKEGLIAKKVGDFYRSFADSTPTEEQEKIFFKKLDEEFGTNLYEENYNKPTLKSGEVRISYKNIKGKEDFKKEIGPPLIQE